jgi:hypothetical protein
MSTGAGYPLTALNGSLVLVSDYAERAKQAIKSAVLTKLDERVWFPEYGSPEALFESESTLAPVLAEFRQSIALGLEDFPDVTFRLYGSLGDSGELLMDIGYQVGDQKGIIQVTLT